MNNHRIALILTLCLLQHLIATSALGEKTPKAWFQCAVEVNTKSEKVVTRQIPLKACTGTNANRDITYSLTGCQEESIPIGDPIALDVDGKTRIAVMHVNIWATTRSGLRSRVRCDGGSIALKEADNSFPDSTPLVYGGFRSANQSFLGPQDFLLWTDGKQVEGHRIVAYCFIRLDT